MVQCEQCGFDNWATDKFCANCGKPLAIADADSGASQPTIQQPEQPATPSRGETPSFMPPPVTPTFSSQPPPPPAQPSPAPYEKTDYDFSQPRAEDSTDSDWRMTSLGPPPPRKRRLWLWIVLGVIILCILVCVGVALWLGFTDSGQEFWDDIEATATAQAED